MLCSKWKKNKATGPNKIPIEFYQTCWPVIKRDSLDLFDEFYKGDLDVKRLNYGVITLLPKVHDAAKTNSSDPFAYLTVFTNGLLKC